MRTDLTLQELRYLRGKVVQERLLRVVTGTGKPEQLQFLDDLDRKLRKAIDRCEASPKECPDHG